jgi:hypothetical protein
VNNVVAFPRERSQAVELGYEQLAREVGMSVRWLQYRVKDGMPYREDYAGRKRFLLSECRPWLDDWYSKNRRSA